MLYPTEALISRCRNSGPGTIRAALTGSDTCADARIVRFPPRRSACIWLLRDGVAWLVLGPYGGWLHGDYHTALADARWLSKNLQLPVRSAVA